MTSLSFDQLLELSLALLPEEKVKLKNLYPQLPPKKQEQIQEIFKKEIRERDKILFQADTKLIEKLKYVQRSKLGGVLRTMIEKHKKIESQESVDIEKLLDTL